MVLISRPKRLQEFVRSVLAMIDGNIPREKVVEMFTPAEEPELPLGIGAATATAIRTRDRVRQGDKGHGRADHEVEIIRRR